MTSMVLTEKYMMRMIESAMDAMITVNAQQEIVLFNAAAETVFKCHRDDVMGQSLSLFIPQRFHHAHLHHMQQFSAMQMASRRMNGQRVVMARRFDGEEFPIEASISHFEQDGTVFYTVILRDVSERLRAEAALNASKQELQQFALASHRVREQEKSRIARELHDELGQCLSALKMDLAWLKAHYHDGTNERIQQKLNSMDQVVDDTVRAARRISTDLRPLILDDLGLNAALEWLTDQFTQRAGIQCYLTQPADELSLDNLQATAIFRIVQEALTNVTKHAQASRVDIELSYKDDSIHLLIQDDGCGFDVSQPVKSDSYGLIGFKERIYLLNGQLNLSSETGKGTRLYVCLPSSAING